MWPTSCKEMWALTSARDRELISPERERCLRVHSADQFTVYPTQQTAVQLRVRCPGLGAGAIVRDGGRGRVLPLLFQREFLLRGFTGCWERRE